MGVRRGSKLIVYLRKCCSKGLGKECHLFGKEIVDAEVIEMCGDCEYSLMKKNIDETRHLTIGHRNVQGRQNQNQRYFAWGNGAAGNGGAQNGAGNANAGQNGAAGLEHSEMGLDILHGTALSRKNGAMLDEEELLFLAGKHANTIDADVDNQPVQDLALNEDNIFQADRCDAFDLDVDDEPTAQPIFMANLSLVGPANLQVGPSNASILSEANVIDSTSIDMGNNNVIPYEQYLSVDNISVVPSYASSVLNDGAPKWAMEWANKCINLGELLPPSSTEVYLERQLCTLPTHGMRCIISMVSISPEGFLPSMLLLVVIIVTVVIVVVTVILVVVVVAITGVVFCKISMLHVPPENNEFEGEIFPM
ncbi:hypothetical protein Tco_0458597 [Tanacetum coccineum]